MDNTADITVAAGAASEHPLGPTAATILATEHWSLLSTRSLIWNEAMSPRRRASDLFWAKRRRHVGVGACRLQSGESCGELCARRTDYRWRRLA
jgi:hypothetical protein